MKSFTTKTRILGFGIFFFTGAAAASHPTKLVLPEGVSLETYRMAATSPEPELISVTHSEKGDSAIERIDAGTWSGKTEKHFTAEIRAQYLKDAYVANSLAAATGPRKTVCFLGDPALFVRAFFGPQVEFANLDPSTGISAAMSSDRYLIGIGGRFDAKDSPLAFSFRLPSCFIPGKDNLVAGLESPLSRSPASELKFVPFTADQKTDVKAMLDTRISNRAPQSKNLKVGFQILDEGAVPPNLRKFDLSADYDKAWTGRKNDRPWKGMNIATKEGQLAFSQMLRDYVYDGMVNNGGSPESVLYPEKNQVRYWCNMPWLNVGPNGREVVHGLTMERPLNPSPRIYPTAPFGSDWGIGFYNAPGCAGIKRVFGTRNAPIPPNYAPLNANGDFFTDGTVAVKFLFTTAGTTAPFPAVNGTHIIQANVIHNLAETARSIKPVRLVQIDVAVKDSTLVGIHGKIGNWVMTTYYYDPSFVTNWKTTVQNVPPGFMRMRPQGVQLGLEIADTTIFDGSGPNGLEGRLNGPADNPKGSCLGCHSVAGEDQKTKPVQHPMVPGFMHDAEYEAIAKGRPTVLLDFSQQLALAKANQQTEIDLPAVPVPKSATPTAPGH